ncbi:hypothetical protein M8C13_36230 [Crossiella sp. SN42]|uniref:hypothetical protein n=1 Tax=Crossiella sp. SN42 TaxID=2944808 RepID=UPI00207CEF23|nr:hypothetical protein [Crossiella sp. SN42]MCO1581212.1 hypothetical protein [Crossiella sp. SN42]
MAKRKPKPKPRPRLEPSPNVAPPEGYWSAEDVAVLTASTFGLDNSFLELPEHGE